MNITRAAIFMNRKVNNRMIMEYEAADIRDMLDDEDYVLIGYVNFDTENKKIVEDF